MTSLFNTEAFNFKFSDIYPEKELFMEDYRTIGLPTTIKDTNAETLYYLLAAKYKNSRISNADAFQFKLKLFSIIWEYGPVWEKRLEIQERLRSLSLDENGEAFIGHKAIYNSASNPETEPTSQATDELNFINNQNTTNFKKGRVEGLQGLYEALTTNITSQFLQKFDKLFKKIAAGKTRTYINYSQED